MEFLTCSDEGVRQGSKKSIPHLWTGKGVVDVQPDGVAFMTDGDVGELVSEGLFPVVLPDFTAQARCRVRPRFISGEFGRAGVDAGDGGGRGVVTPTNAAATSCRRLLLEELSPRGTKARGLRLQLPAPTLGASFY